MKLKVIHNLIDKQCGVVRYVDEVFEADEERAKELIKLGFININYHGKI
jgi:hypothetical protein|nr:MAG TPA: hypothetical protein [Caudoviricetes sp.]